MVLGFFAKPFSDVVDLLKRAFCGGKRIQSKILPIAVMRSDERVADGARRVAFGQQVVKLVKIIKRLAHLLPINKQMIGMHPITNKLLAGRAFGLRNFGFVMRKFVVLGAGVNIDRFAQVLGGHGRTLNVPARITIAPWRFPLQKMIWIIDPKSKIKRAFLFIVYFDARAGF